MAHDLAQPHTGGPAPQDRRRTLAARCGALVAVAVAAFFYPPAAITFVVAAVVFIPLERLTSFRLQPIRRRAWQVDALHFVVTTSIAAGITTAGAALLRLVLAGLPLDGLHDAVGSLPRVVQLGIAFVTADLAAYWHHRAQHRFKLLWRFHALHHSIVTLDWLASDRAHPIDSLCTRLAQFLPLYLLGLTGGTFGALAVLGALFHVWIHSNVRLPLGPLRYLVGSPDVHQWHHDLKKGNDVNYAIQFPWIDAVFGTLYLPGNSRPERFGIKAATPPDLVHQLLAPLTPVRRPAQQ